jgi:hypothetical protein
MPKRMPRKCKNGKKNCGVGSDSDNDNEGSNCKDDSAEESEGEWESETEPKTKAPQTNTRQSRKSTPRHKIIPAGRGTIAKKSLIKAKKTGGRSTAQRREVIADSENRGCVYYPTKFCGVHMRVYPSGKTTFSARVWNGHEEKAVQLGVHDTDVKAAEVVDAYRMVLAKRHSDDGYLKNLNFKNGNFVYKGKSHGYKGITWEESKKKWKAQIYMSKGAMKHLGRFVNPDDAARAFDAKVIELKLGKALNFPKL